MQVQEELARRGIIYTDKNGKKRLTGNNKQKYEEVVDVIYRMRELKEKILIGIAERQGKRKRIAEMAEFLNTQPDRVTVYSGKLTVEFKKGTEV